MLHTFLVCDGQYAQFKHIEEQVVASFSDVQMFYSPHTEEWQTQLRNQLEKRRGSRENENDADLEAEIQNLIIDAIIIDAKFLPSLEAIKKIAANVAVFSGGVRPKFFVMGHEGVDGETAEAFATPEINDFFYKPIDGLLLLEKLHSHLEGLRRIDDNKSFLYSSDQKFPIEVAQEQQIVALSPYGVKIQTPFPIKVGAILKIHSTLFGGTNKEGLWVQCIESTMDSRLHLNTFAWYALRPEQHEPIKNWFKAHQPPESLTTDQEKLAMIEERKKKKKGPVIHGIETKKEVRHVVAIDLDPETTATLSDFFSTNEIEHEIHSSGSILNAAKRLFPDSEAQFPIEENRNSSHSLELARKPAFLPSPVKFRADKKSFDLISFHTNGSLLLGVPALDWEKDPALWKNRISPQDSDRFSDFLKFLATEQDASASFHFRNNENEVHPVLVEARFQDGQLEITLEDLSLELQKTPKNELKALEKIELIVIDFSFVQKKTSQWLRELRRLIDENDRNPKKRKTPILLVGSEKFVRSMNTFNGFASDGFLVKPLDRIHFLQYWELQTNHQKPLEKHSLHSWAQTKHYVDISRPAEATEMGEKGLSIYNSRPVAIGAQVRFYHSSLTDHEGRGMLARCYRSEAMENGQYRCQFAFFGVKESQLKNIRKLWVAGS